MFRHKSTDANGKAFAPELIEAVWERAQASPEHAPLRVDVFGALMWRPAFGNTNSKLGWEIHHRIPVEQGGGDELDNLEAVQWENHRRLDAASARLIAEADSGDDSNPEGNAVELRVGPIEPVPVAP
jgi:HNH endonuclease